MQVPDIPSIISRLGIDNLTLMQQSSIDAFRNDCDVVLLSPTGSGKTLAYLLPISQTLQQSVLPQVLVLVPSRELALQSEHVFKSMSIGLPAMSCYGGRPTMDEHRLMKSLNPVVVFATPGRVLDHLVKGNIDPKEIHTLVIDEFDKCLELGFRDEMMRVVGYLSSVRRRFLLSATEASDIPRFVSARNVLKLSFLDDDSRISNRISVMSVRSPEKDKLNTLSRLLCCFGSESTLVFVGYRESVERVGKFLRNKGFHCEIFHGGLEQPMRESALYKFSAGSSNIMISTDLASRGLDIPMVDNIVHYHLPLNEECFVHRNGRTARWDAKGKAWLLVGPEEKVPEFVGIIPDDFVFPEKIQSIVEPIWATIYIGKGKKEKLSRTDILGFLIKVGGLSAQDVGRIDVRDHYSFVAIKRLKVKSTLANVTGSKIKGLKTIIELSR